MTVDRIDSSVRGKVEVSETGCWLWRGALSTGGYGPHRKVYKRIVGPIPEGLQLDHLCRQPSCVNPDHLEPVTRIENIRRREAIPNRRPRRGRTPKADEILVLMMTGDIADFLGVSRQYVQRLVLRADFPRPLGTVKAGHIWKAEAVEKWAAQHRSKS